jgi:hypothetical protein
MSETTPDPSDLPPDPTEPGMRPGDVAPPGTPDTGENLCPHCGGSGRHEDGSSCPVCEGTGRVVEGIGGG